jgi:flagellar biosynthesis protein FliP
MNKRILRSFAILGLLAMAVSSCAVIPESSATGVSLDINTPGGPEQVSSGVQLLVLITILSLAPSILVLMTSFTRMVIVLSMVRTAIGTPTVPPNQVILGLALLLTFFVMTPVYTKMDEQAIQPFLNEEIDQETALNLAVEPLREFMFGHTREKDLELFLSIQELDAPEVLDDIPTTALVPAFVISELRAAFLMGFVIYVPFLLIDLVVSSVLLSMGMMMLPPSLISLPFKILLFVMVDGWYLIVQSLVVSFQM